MQFLQKILRDYLLALVICLLLLSSFCIAQEGTYPTPLDLSSKGYFDLSDASPNERLIFGQTNGQLAFVGKVRVAISFLIANKAIGLTDRNHIDGGKWLFHTLVVNVASNRSEAEWDWWSASSESRLIPVETGQFLISSEERITLQRLDGHTLWRLDLPETGVLRSRAHGTAIESNTGNTVYVLSDKDKETLIVDVYRTSDRSISGTFTIPNQGLLSDLAASDEGLIYKDRDSPTLIFIDRSGTSSHRVVTCQDACRHLQFVGADRLVLDDGHRILLLDRQGRVLQKHELVREYPGRISVCSSGKRLMVELYKWGGGSAFFDTSGKVTAARIAVLDAGTLREVASLAVDPKQTVRAGINPIGNLIAYIDNGILKFWSLPEPTEGR